MVKTGGYLVGEGKECGGGGAGPSEAVLGFREGELVGDLGKEESLEDLNCGTKEGDGTVGVGQVSGFIGLGDGDDVGMLPYGGYGSSIEGVVK